MRERKALLDALQDAEENKFDILVIHRLSRFGRCAKDLLNNHERLKKSGIELRSLKESIDFSNPYGKAMLTMLSAIAELEREIIAENTIENRIALANKNIPASGKLPYGRTYENGEWGIDKEKKKNMEWAAQRYAIEGESIEILAKKLDMNRTGLLRTLKWRCGKVWKVKFKDEKIEMKVPSLLDDKMINAIHRKAEANKTCTHGHIKNKYLLSRVILCGHCGYAMFGQTDSRGNRYYRHFKKGKNECKDFSSFIPANNIEEAALSHLVSMYENEEKIEKAIRATIPNRKEIKKLRTERDVYEKSLIKLQKEKENLLRAIRKGIVSDEDAEKDMNKIKEREELLTNDIAKINPQIEVEDHTLEDIELIKDIARYALGAFSLDTFEGKKELIQTAFNGKGKKGERLGVYIFKDSRGDLCYTIKGAFQEKITGKLPFTLSMEEEFARLPINPEYESITLNKKKSNHKKNDKLKVRSLNLYLNR